jgi:bifunctional DNA-binding transcriptional regulator/antitoxin component of YhaV-PrlF toxin-antitoxin module
MRSELVISDKGQITLPRDLRTQMGLKAADVIVYALVENGVLMTPKTLDFNKLQEFLGTPPNGPAALGDIEAAVAAGGGRQAMPQKNVLRDDAA